MKRKYAVVARGWADVQTAPGDWPKTVRLKHNTIVRLGPDNGSTHGVEVMGGTWDGLPCVISNEDIREIPTPPGLSE